jgi:hypothetical protein
MRNVIFVSQTGIRLSVMQNPTFYQIDENLQIQFSNSFRDSVSQTFGNEKSKYEFISAITIQNGEITESIRYGRLTPVSNLESVLILNSKFEILKYLVNPNSEYITNMIEHSLLNIKKLNTNNSFLTIGYLRNGFVIRSAKYRSC